MEQPAYCSTLDTAFTPQTAIDQAPSAWPPTDRYVVAPKPAGGFAFLTVLQLALVWSAYRAKAITWFDLRVWFAAVEMRARRCQMPSDKQAHFLLNELRRLVGTRRLTRLRTALRRLQAVGLLTWTPTAITLIDTPTQLNTDRIDYATMFTAIPNNDRKVPVPRQTLRYIATNAPSTRKTLVAAMLGVMCRCLYYDKRQKQCRSGGTCKASWIAQVFGIDLRHAKREMAHLQEIGWHIRQPSAHWYAQRHGGRTILNLEWTRPPESGLQPRSPDVTDEPAAKIDHKLPLPDSDSELSTRLANHSSSNSPHPSDPVPIAESLPTPPPAAAVLPPGDTDTAQPHSAQAAHPLTAQPQEPRMSEQLHRTAQAVQRQRHSKPPTDSPLRDIRREDLQTAAGILRLFEAFCQQELPHTEANLLNVLAAAHYALRQAQANAPRYFRALVERQAWDWIRDQDYEAARRQAVAEAETMPPARTPVHQLITALAASQRLGTKGMADTSPTHQHGHASKSQGPLVRTYHLFDTTEAKHEEQRCLVESQEQAAWQQQFDTLPEVDQQQFLTAAEEVLEREKIKPDYRTPFQIRRIALDLFEAQQLAREGPPESEESP